MKNRLVKCPTCGKKSKPRRVIIDAPPWLDDWLYTMWVLAIIGRLPRDPGLWLTLATGMHFYVQERDSGLDDIRRAMGQPESVAFHRETVEAYSLRHRLTADDLDDFDLSIPNCRRPLVTSQRQRPPCSWHENECVSLFANLRWDGRAKEEKCLPEFLVP